MHFHMKYHNSRKLPKRLSLLANFFNGKWKLFNLQRRHRFFLPRSFSLGRGSVVMQISVVKLIFLLPSDLISGGGKSLGGLP